MEIRPTNAAPVKTFIACSGLGHIHRGFETFSRECFETLRSDNRLNVRLFQGYGIDEVQCTTIRCLIRSSRLAKWIGRATRGPYFVEQVTFAIGLRKYLASENPDVVFFSDGVIGNFLWRWRRLTKQKFKLLLSNGGPLGPPAFPRFDHVHQVSPLFYDQSAAAGRSSETQTLIPYGISAPNTCVPATESEVCALRARLKIPTDRQIVLCVGAINRAHKRTDYVIREIARMKFPRPYLVLLGQFESESSIIVKEAEQLLGPSGFCAASVSPSRLPDFYRVADVFTLGSTKEGFGRVFVEAMIQGLRCIVHDGPVQRYVVGKQGVFVNMQEPGALALGIEELLKTRVSPSEKFERSQNAIDRFGWNQLREKYVQMIMKCAAK